MSSDLKPIICLDESDLTNGYLDTAIDWIPSMPGIHLKGIPSFIRTTDRDDVMLNFDGGERHRTRARSTGSSSTRTM